MKEKINRQFSTNPVYKGILNKGKLREQRNALIMELHDNGLTPSQIAPQVRLSPYTVRNYLARMKKESYE